MRVWEVQLVRWEEAVGDDGMRVTVVEAVEG